MTKVSISAASSFIMRVKLGSAPSAFSRLAAVIEASGGQIGAIDISHVSSTGLVRDITIFASSAEHAEEIQTQVASLPEVEVVHVSDRTFLLHLGGKIEIKSRIPLKNRDDLSMAYTPGVAKICEAIYRNPMDAYNLTIKKNTVAVISDGTAILGLGDLGPYAAMPVMEGKALLCKEFAGVDAFPICLDTKDTEEIIRVVQAIAPAFGAINLEDISAPRCFEIEERLQALLDIPVFHDDQHGTAVVLTAALINALKIVKKPIETLKVVLVGTGAAGTACTNMILNLGVKNIIGYDREGPLWRGRAGLSPAKAKYAERTNPHLIKADLAEGLRDADVFIGLSGPGVLTAKEVKTMAKDAIIFAMSNPTPEIMPEEAAPYAKIIATGRSDYPNQINNVLCFPGLFRGVLDCLATRVTEEMKLAAAEAIASVIPEAHLHPDYIIPSVFDKNVVPAVAEAVRKAAIQSGVARKVKDIDR